MQACLLEEAPAPADAGDRRGIARRRGVQLAASGRSVMAAAWAMASVPRSLPGATTAAGASRETSPAITRPHACGA